MRGIEGKEPAWVDFAKAESLFFKIISTFEDRDTVVTRERWTCGGSGRRKGLAGAADGAVTLGRIAAPAHEGGVGEVAAATFAVRVDVVDGEVVPSEHPLAVLAGALRRRAPDHAALFLGEAALGILAGKKAFEEGAKDFFAMLALV